MEDTYALKYTQPLIRGMGFNRTLIEVREPHKVWRAPAHGATVDEAVRYLIGKGYRMAHRSHHNGGGLKTVTEVWEKNEEEAMLKALCAAYDQVW